MEDFERPNEEERETSSVIVVQQRISTSASQLHFQKRSQKHVQWEK